MYPRKQSYSGLVSRIAVVLAVLAAAALGAPGLARAQERTLTFTTGPISVPAFSVVQQPMAAKSPAVDGYVVGMDAEVVDAAGRVQGRDRVMLHHIVFAKVGAPDYTCGGFTERFFAEGEERMALSLPSGYGYANKATDRWALLYMLMNHKPQTLKGYIRYHVRYVTGEARTPVKPVWLDVRNCSGPDPVFDVPGGGKSFSTFTKTADFTMPESGRLVAGGGHLHGGGIRLELRNATCGTTAVRVAAHLGRAEAAADPPRAGPDEDVGVPVDRGDSGREGAEAPARRRLREPRAAHASDGDHAALLRSRRGVRAARRRRSSRSTSDGRPPRRRSRCRCRARRAGPVSKALSTWVGDFRYGAERISIRRGSTFTWRFVGSFAHDVTVVGGPEGFSAPWTQSGTFTHRFTKPGTYRLFCSLHPAKMVQQITVR